MSRTIRGKREGTGPYMKSYQSMKSKIAKSRQAGIPCPKKKK